jgi:hypothetical protein
MSALSNNYEIRLIVLYLNTLMTVIVIRYEYKTTSIAND